MQVSITSFLCLAISSYLLCFLYQNFWGQFNFGRGVPKGFGVFAPVLMLATTYLTQEASNYSTSLAILTFLTFVYWFDDLLEMKPALRLGLMVMLLLVLLPNTPLVLEHLSILALLGSVIAWMIISLILVNTINFYDGADLNLSTLIFLFSASNIYFLPSDSPLVFLFSCWLSIVLGFSLRNIVPNTIYFGDSGCYSFAATILLLFAAMITQGVPIEPLTLSPLFLPLFDVFFVLFIRVIKREHLLSRNYYHLYQRIQQSNRIRFLYLLPQLVNFLISVMSYLILQKLNVTTTVQILVMLFGVTPITYFSFYYFCGNFIGLFGRSSTGEQNG